MPRAKNRYERATQVAAWCNAHWPVGRAYRLVWVDWIKDEEEGPRGGRRLVEDRTCYGRTSRVGSEMLIELSRKRCRSWEQTSEVVIHEMAHAYLWPIARVEDEREHHSPAFWAQYGEMIDRFYHDHGAEESAEYEVT